MRTSLLFRRRRLAANFTRRQQRGATSRGAVTRGAIPRLFKPFLPLVRWLQQQSFSSWLSRQRLWLDSRSLAQIAEFYEIYGRWVGLDRDSNLLGTQHSRQEHCAHFFLPSPGLVGILWYLQLHYHRIETFTSRKGSNTKTTCRR
jgi:hypothetical protein